MNRLPAAILIGALAAGGAFGASQLTDASVAVDGETVFCRPSEFDSLPAEIEDRCDAQRDDRRRQALLAAGGAGTLALLGAVVTGRTRGRVPTP